MNKRERRILAAVAIAGSLFVAACGDRSTHSSSSQSLTPEPNPHAVSDRSSQARAFVEPTPWSVRERPTFTPTK